MVTLLQQLLHGTEEISHINAASSPPYLGYAQEQYKHRKYLQNALNPPTFTKVTSRPLIPLKIKQLTEL